jgi:catechol 2,3-dioxygenase-like lactoylglutathione lyase family enzyme
MLKTQGVAHFSLPVRDLERSIAFYADILGLQLVFRTPELAFFRSGKDHVILARTDAGPADANGRNVHHAFIVESRDFEAGLEFLASRAVTVIDRDSRPEGAVFAGRSAYFADPDGNVLEMIDLAAMGFRPR